MLSSKSKQLHALAIPLPGQGHINPLMRFCKRLGSEHGFTITFVDLVDPFVEGVAELNMQERESTHGTEALGERECANPQANISLISKTELTSMDVNAAGAAVGKAEAEEKLDIRRVRIPLDWTKIIGAYSKFEALFEAMDTLSPLIELLVSRLMNEQPPITCLISDLYMTVPTQKVADKFHIPRLAFHTTSQSVLLFKNYVLEGTISLDQALKVVTGKEVSKDDTFVEGLLGLPTLRNGDVMNYYDDNILFYTINLKILKESKERAHAIVVNSMKELEEPSFKCNIGDVPIYPVGPLIEPLDKEASTSLWEEDKDCILWLNEQPSQSVIFISFGSFATLPIAQLEEIMAGLIASKQRFLWVLRSNLVKEASDSSYLGDLLLKAHDKGHFVEWAPQMSVLSHPSVGGFLTHCGWNSTIEAITLGVPMLCFPYMPDQFMNARFIIEEWKVGLGLKRCKESGLVKRDEVERVIRALMVEEEGNHLHRNAKEICQNIQRGGRSSASIKMLVDSLR